ncbi:MAG: helix-turn-helix domain-containing protein [Candidatus Omnitrophota bacterium]
MTETILNKNIRNIIKKAIAAILAVAFLFNDVAFAADYQNLAPKSALTIEEFRERFEEGYGLLNHKAINSYIESVVNDAGGFENLEKREDRLRIGGKLMPILIVAIPDLFKKRGQFAHEGLGKWNGVPVIYADKSLAYYNESRLQSVKRRIASNEIREREHIIDHSKNELRQWIPWKIARKNLSENWRHIFNDYDFRNVWIIGNPGAKEAAYAFHRNSGSLKHLFEKYKHLLDWDELYKAYIESGETFDRDDSDVNIAAGNSSHGSGKGKGAKAKAKLREWKSVNIPKLRDLQEEMAGCVPGVHEEMNRAIEASEPERVFFHLAKAWRILKTRESAQERIFCGRIERTVFEFSKIFYDKLSDVESSNRKIAIYALWWLRTDFGKSTPIIKSDVEYLFSVLRFRSADFFNPGSLCYTDIRDLKSYEDVKNVFMKSEIHGELRFAEVFRRLKEAAAYDENKKDAHLARIGFYDYLDIIELALEGHVFDMQSDVRDSIFYLECIKEKLKSFVITINAIRAVFDDENDRSIDISSYQDLIYIPHEVETLLEELKDYKFVRSEPDRFFVEGSRKISREKLEEISGKIDEWTEKINRIQRICPRFKEIFCDSKLGKHLLLGQVRGFIKKTEEVISGKVPREPIFKEYLGHGKSQKLNEHEITVSAKRAFNGRSNRALGRGAELFPSIDSLSPMDFIDPARLAAPFGAHFWQGRRNKASYEESPENMCSVQKEFELNTQHHLFPFLLLESVVRKSKEDTSLGIKFKFELKEGDKYREIPISAMGLMREGDKLSRGTTVRLTVTAPGNADNLLFTECLEKLLDIAYGILTSKDTVQPDKEPFEYRDQVNLRTAEALEDLNKAKVEKAQPGQDELIKELSEKEMAAKPAAWGENRRLPFKVKPEDVVIYYKKAGESLRKGSANSIWNSLPAELKNARILAGVADGREGIILLSQSADLDSAAASYDMSEVPISYSILSDQVLSDRRRERLCGNGIHLFGLDGQTYSNCAHFFKLNTAESVESGDGRQWLKLSMAKKYESLLPLFLKRNNIMSENIIGSSVGAVNLNGLKPGEYCRASWIELGEVARLFGIQEELFANMTIEEKDGVEQETIDRKMVDGLLSDPLFVGDVFRDIFARPDLVLSDIVSVDIRHVGEGSFKKAYEVNLKIKGCRSALCFMLKVVKSDVIESDSGYLYNEKFARTQIEIARKARKKILHIYPPVIDAKLVKDSRSKVRIVFAEGIVPQTNASLSQSRLDRYAIRTYLLFYLLFDRKIFLEDPKRANVVIHKRPRLYYDGTMIDLDNFTQDDHINPYLVVSALIHSGFGIEDIAEAAEEVFGTKDAVSFLEYAYGRDAGKQISNFEGSLQAIRLRMESNAKSGFNIPSSMEIKLNTIPQSIPVGATIFDILSERYIDIQDYIVRINGKTVSGERDSMTHKQRMGIYQEYVVKDGDEIVFYPKDRDGGSIAPEGEGSDGVALSKTALEKHLEYEKFDERLRTYRRSLSSMRRIVRPYLFKDNILTQKWDKTIVLMIDKIDQCLKDYSMEPIGVDEAKKLKRCFDGLKFKNKNGRQECLPYINSVIKIIEKIREEYELAVASVPASAPVVSWKHGVPADEAGISLNDGMTEAQKEDNAVIKRNLPGAQFMTPPMKRMDAVPVTGGLEIDLMSFKTKYDARYDRYIAGISDQVLFDDSTCPDIAQRLMASSASLHKDGKVCIAAFDGPAGAFKTTSAKKTAALIRASGKKAVVISRDWFIGGRNERYVRQDEELSKNAVSLRDDEISLRRKKFEKEVLDRLEEFNRSSQPQMILDLRDLYNKYGGGGLDRNESVVVDRDTIVIIEGNYLLKKDWRHYFDVGILMLARPSISIARRLPRDAVHADTKRVEKIFWRINTPSFINYIENEMPAADINVVTDSCEAVDPDDTGFTDAEDSDSKTSETKVVSDEVILPNRADAVTNIGKSPYLQKFITLLGIPTIMLGINYFIEQVFLLSAKNISIIVDSENLMTLARQHCDLWAASLKTSLSYSINDPWSCHIEICVHYVNMPYIIYSAVAFLIVFTSFILPRMIEYNNLHQSGPGLKAAFLFLSYGAILNAFDVFLWHGVFDYIFGGSPGDISMFFGTIAVFFISPFILQEMLSGNAGMGDSAGDGSDAQPGPISSQTAANDASGAMSRSAKQAFNNKKPPEGNPGERFATGFGSNRDTSRGDVVRVVSQSDTSSKISATTWADVSEAELLKYAEVLAKILRTRYGKHANDYEYYADIGVQEALRTFDPAKGTTLSEWIYQNKGLWAAGDAIRKDLGVAVYENGKKRLVPVPRQFFMNIGDEGKITEEEASVPDLSGKKDGVDEDEIGVWEAGFLNDANIKLLSPAAKFVVRLSCEDGKTSKEIARILHKKYTNVREIISYISDKVKKGEYADIDFWLPKSFVSGNPGERIYKIRNALKMSQRDLGNTVGVSVEAISSWERGVTYPTYNRAILLATKSRVPLEYILTGEGDEESILARLREIKSSRQRVIEMILRLKADRNLSSTMLASELGLGSTVLADILKGKTARFNKKTQQALLRYFKLPDDYFEADAGDGSDAQIEPVVSNADAKNHRGVGAAFYNDDAFSEKLPELDKEDLSPAPNVDADQVVSNTFVVDVKTGMSVPAKIKKLRRMLRGTNEMITIPLEVDGNMEGRLIYSETDPLYINLLSTNSENLYQAGAGRKFKHVGWRLMQAIVKLSKDTAAKGAIRLNSMKTNVDAQAFYETMRPLGLASVPVGDDIDWYLEVKDADRFIEGIESAIADRRAEIVTNQDFADTPSSETVSDYASYRYEQYNQIDSIKFGNLLRKYMKRPLSESEQVKAAQFIEAMHKVRDEADVVRSLNNMLGGNIYPNVCLEVCRNAEEVMNNDFPEVEYIVMQKTEFYDNNPGQHNFYPYDERIYNIWWDQIDMFSPLHEFLVIKFFGVPFILDLSADQFVMSKPDPENKWEYTNFVEQGMVMIPAAELQENDRPYTGAISHVDKEQLWSLLNGESALVDLIVGVNPYWRSVKPDAPEREPTMNAATPAEFLMAIRDEATVRDGEALLTQAIAERGFKPLEAERLLCETLETLGVLEKVMGSESYRLTKMMRGPKGGNEAEYAQEMLNRVMDLRHLSGARAGETIFGAADIGNARVAKELVTMTAFNKIDRDIKPAIPDNKIVWRIIENEIVPIAQQSTFITKLNKASAASDSTEKVHILNGRETVAEAMAAIRSECPNAIFDVAVSDASHIKDVLESDAAARVLVVNGKIVDFAQIEGVVAALRALRMPDRSAAVAALLRIYSVLNGRAYNGQIDPSLLDDPVEFARQFTLDLPPTRQIPAGEISKMNERLIAFMISA